MLPSITTLFPYTTLFRSGLGEAREALTILRPLPERFRKLGHRSNHIESEVLLARALAAADLPGEASHVAAQAEADARAHADRKSTRQNFSHSSLSYAAFC